MFHATDSCIKEECNDLWNAIYKANTYFGALFKLWQAGDYHIDGTGGVAFANGEELNRLSDEAARACHAVASKYDKKPYGDSND